MRKCKWCKITLTKRRVKSKEGKSGYRIEAVTSFSKRVYCGTKCLSEGARKQNTIWSEEKILLKFNKIKNENKYHSRWLQKHYNGLFGAVTRCYGKNYWVKFLSKSGKEPIYNRKDPKHVRVARQLLKYWKTELDIKPHKVFAFAQKWYMPSEEVKNVNYRNVIDALYYLREKKVIKLYKRGDSIAHKMKEKNPSQYILLRENL